MNMGSDKSNGAALAAALLLGLPAADIVFGGNPGALHAVFAACGAGLMAVWLKEA